MTLPSSGVISMSNVNTELGLSSTATISLNDSAVRSLFGKASGVISMSDGYGKSSLWKGTISTHLSQVNLRSWALANGWNGTSAAEVTIASGIYVYSDNTAVAAFTIDGSWPAGLTLVNNGYIMGKGGNGYGGASYPPPTTTQSGGAAIVLSAGLAISINNQNGYIAGGGGGGGGIRLLADASNYGPLGVGGGGAGGGAGGDTSYSGSYFVAGGAGGGIGKSGGNSTWVPELYCATGGGGGGRIIGGSGGSGYTLAYQSGYWTYGNPSQGGGAGGGGGGNWDWLKGTGNSGGGTGGAQGTTGGAGFISAAAHPEVCVGGGGGGFGAMGGVGLTNQATGVSVVSPGLGGSAVVVNSASVTWVGGFPSSRVFGAVS